LGLYYCRPANEIRENFRTYYESLERLSALSEYAGGRRIRPSRPGVAEQFNLNSAQIRKVWATLASWRARRGLLRCHLREHITKILGLDNRIAWHCRRGRLVGAGNYRAFRNQIHRIAMFDDDEDKLDAVSEDEIVIRT